MSNINKTNTKFQIGDRVICNQNHESYVLRYYTDKMLEVRLWRGTRHIGDVCVHEEDLKIQEVQPCLNQS